MISKWKSNNFLYNESLCFFSVFSQTYKKKLNIKLDKILSHQVLVILLTKVQIWLIIIFPWLQRQVDMGKCGPYIQKSLGSAL